MWTYIWIIILVSISWLIGTWLVAEEATPWDTLYTVKTNVNQEIKEFMTFSQEAKAQLQLNLMAERIEEKLELNQEWELTAEINNMLNSQISTRSSNYITIREGIENNQDNSWELQDLEERFNYLNQINQEINTNFSWNTNTWSKNVDIDLENNNNNNNVQKNQNWILDWAIDVDLNLGDLEPNNDSESNQTWEINNSTTGSTNMEWSIEWNIDSQINLQNNWVNLKDKSKINLDWNLEWNLNLKTSYINSKYHVDNVNWYISVISRL